MSGLKKVTQEESLSSRNEAGGDISEHLHNISSVRLLFYL